MLFAFQVYDDTGNSESHYHECESEGVDVYGTSFFVT